ncbi:MAG: class I SAM-dependent methyltransferase [Anaerolineae bacterium]
MTSREYHLRELAIAQSADDPRHVMPAILPRHRRILDIGCGAGQTLIASDLLPGVRAAGLDVDFEALLLGRELTGRVGFVAGPAEHLPFPAASFDLVLSRVTLPLTCLPAAVAEIGRVTAPGGDIWLVLHSLGKTLHDLRASLRGGHWKRAAYRSYVLANGALLHLTGRLLPSPLDGHYESFQTDLSIGRELRRAGFTDIAISTGHHYVVTARRV